MNRTFLATLRVLSLVGVAALMTACPGDTPDVDYFETLRTNPDVNKAAWYTSMGTLCSEGEPRPGCTFRYDGSKVVLQQDPLYAKVQGFSFSRTSFQDTRYVEECDFDGYCYETTEKYTNYRVYVHTPDGKRIDLREWHIFASVYAEQLGGWSFSSRQSGNHLDVNDINILSPTGIKYGYDGIALNAAKMAGGSNGKDVVGSIAEVRADQIKGIAEVLQAKFELDADVSEQAAASLVDWSEIGSKRARTHDDMAAFSMRVYGIELGRIEDVALLARDGKTELALKEMNDMVGEAAQNWRTSPETMREVLAFFYGNLMN